jgi:hypothetical protein
MINRDTKDVSPTLSWQLFNGPTFVRDRLPFVKSVLINAGQGRIVVSGMERTLPESTQVGVITLRGFTASLQRQYLSGAKKPLHY